MSLLLLFPDLGTPVTNDTLYFINSANSPKTLDLYVSSTLTARWQEKNYIVDSRDVLRYIHLVSGD